VSAPTIGGVPVVAIVLFCRTFGFDVYRLGYVENTAIVGYVPRKFVPQFRPRDVPITAVSKTTFVNESSAVVATTGNHSAAESKTVNDRFENRTEREKSCRQYYFPNMADDQLYSAAGNVDETTAFSTTAYNFVIFQNSFGVELFQNVHAIVVMCIYVYFVQKFIRLTTVGGSRYRAEFWRNAIRPTRVASKNFRTKRSCSIEPLSLCIVCVSIGTTF